jgi:predicted aminopeptidase
MVAVVGCESLSYYRQAIAGQYQILSTQQPITKLIANTNTPATLRDRFRTVLDLREFAEKELFLPADRHYLKYSDVHRRHVVWNVYAAPELSLEQKTWWYPIVGSLKYRGYFSEKAARNYAAKLRRDCWDVYVSGVDAYSTLGWFKEPLLNTFIYDNPADLAETIFHELGHQRLFISGDTDFNEAFATLVGQEGTRRWLAQKGDTNALETYKASLAREDEYVRLVQATRAKLKVLYESNRSAPEKKAQKTAILEDLRAEYQRLKESWQGDRTYDRWFASELNNAKLNTVATYHDLLPAFTRLLDSCGGDLKRFYGEVEKLKQLSKEERRKRLSELSFLLM